MFLLETVEADPLQSLQNQVGCSVASPDTRANQADARDRKKSSSIAIASLWLEQSDGEHAMLSQCVLQHFTITRFKNVKRKKRVRKKEDAGQGHDRNDFRGESQTSSMT